jgi:hypothetical protein
MKHWPLERCLSVLLKSMACLSILLVAPARTPAQSFSQWGSLEPGSYAVGFKIITTWDRSRTYDPGVDFEGRSRKVNTSRPIQIWMWYPALKSARQERMPYEEYLYLSGASGVDRAEARRKFFAAPLAAGAEIGRLDALMKTRTALLRNARRAAGTFPLLIFGQGIGFESPISHTIICEYLASHGYTVVACPLVGFNSPVVGNNLVSLETEVRDMEFVIGYVRSLPAFPTTKLGVLGFDLGGMAAVLLQMRNSDVSAVCSVGSGITFKHNTDVLKQSSFYDLSRLTAPLVQMSVPRRDIERLGMQEDNALFEQQSHADQYYLRLRGIDHPDVTSLGMISTGDVPNFVAPGELSGNSSERRLGYETACRYTLKFLDSYLTGDSSALAYLKSPLDGASQSGLITVEVKPAQHLHPTEQQFTSMVRSEGIRKAAAAYRKIRQMDPDYIPFKEYTLNYISYKLTAEGKVEDAIEALKLNVEAYPRSSNCYDRLGGAYSLHGDKELAIANYRKAVELDPNNQHSIERLKRLTDK